jgi:hypothetical protein
MFLSTVHVYLVFWHIRLVHCQSAGTSPKKGCTNGEPWRVSTRMVKFTISGHYWLGTGNQKCIVRASGLMGTKGTAPICGLTANLARPATRSLAEGVISLILARSNMALKAQLSRSSLVTGHTLRARSLIPSRLSSYTIASRSARVKSNLIQVTTTISRSGCDSAFLYCLDLPTKNETSLLGPNRLRELLRLSRASIIVAIVSRVIEPLRVI